MMYYLCTLFAPKMCKLSIEYGAYFLVLVLMLLIKFVPNDTISNLVLEGAVTEQTF